MSNSHRESRRVLASAAAGDAMPPYVSEASGRDVVIRNAASIEDEMRRDWSAKPSKNHTLRIVRRTERDKARLFGYLRDRRVCFSAGREWNPVEVFEHLAEMELLEGPFLEIRWTGPDEWLVVEHEK